jgi:DNA-binding XRE family transcriptional regulator
MKHNLDNNVPIARRLRFLRGEATQEEFSKRLGISRSALANYETGRSRPNSFILNKILDICDVDPSYFDDPGGGSSSYASVAGAIIEGRPQFTEDEMAIVRLLRACDPKTVVMIVNTVLDAIATQPLAGHIAMFLHLEDDILRLDAIRENGGRFARGEMYVEGEKVMQRLRSKMVPQSVPQDLDNPDKSTT